MGCRVLKILGHIIDDTGIKMDPEKISIIKDIKAPQTVKQLQTFLGLSNYYRKLIENYAKITSPLDSLISPKNKWDWSFKCQNAFESLRKLIKYPILRKVDFNNKFILYTDASTIALGAFLTQINNNENEYVVCYVSRLLQPNEKHYSVTEP